MATAAFFYGVLALVISTIALVAFVRSLRGLPVPPEAGSSKSVAPTALSVVMLLEDDVDVEHPVAALLAQSHPELEIVVVSSAARIHKETRRRLAEDPRVRLVELDDIPPGWTRRNYGFAAGYRATRHDYVLLVDGHVLIRPDGLRRAMNMATRRGVDLLTIFPELTATTWAERLMIPFLLQLTLSGASFSKINNPEYEAAGGFAPFFLFRRAAYDAVRGHASVRADRFADSTLAHRVKESGYRLLLAHGIEIVVLQGKTSFAEIWKSWSHSFNAAIDNNRKQAFGVASLIMAVFAVPWLLFVLAVVLVGIASESVAASPWTGVAMIGIANVLVGILHRLILKNTLAIDNSLVILQPLAALVTSVMIVASSYHMEGSWLARITRRAGSPPTHVRSRPAA